MIIKLIVGVIYLAAFLMWKKARKEEEETQKELEEKRKKDEYLARKYSIRF